MIDELNYREIPHISRKGLTATESPSLKDVVDKINEIIRVVNQDKLEFFEKGVEDEN